MDERLGVLQKILDQSYDIRHTINGSIYRKNFKTDHFKRLAFEIYEDIHSERLLDPYWPKWDSPWWKILFLFETSNMRYIQKEIILRFIRIVDEHYLHFFPKKEEELPEGVNPYTDIICFCALGSMIKVACSKEIDIIEELPWVDDIITSNILPDGGYNCDESVYTESERSSIISTLVMFEGLLDYEQFSDKYSYIIDHGIDYFLKRDLFYSTSGDIIDKRWLKPIFPRFYEIDILRILTFVVNWAQKRERRLDEETVLPAIENMKRCENDKGYIILEREWLKNEGTLINVDGKWIFTEEASYFEILEKLSEINRPSHYLTGEWHKTLRGLSKVLRSGVLS